MDSSNDMVSTAERREEFEVPKLTRETAKKTVLSDPKEERGHSYSKYVEGNCSHWGDGVEFLQVGVDYTSQVLKMLYDTIVKYFPSLTLKDVLPQDELIMKVYEAEKLRQYYRKYSWDINGTEDDFTQAIFMDFLLEVACYIKIEEYNEIKQELQKIRTPKMYDYGNIMLFENKHLRWFGWFVLMSYVKNVPKTANMLTLDDGVQQLKEMATLGIYHGLRARNLIVNGGRIHFIDFAEKNICDQNTKDLQQMGTELGNYLEGISADAIESTIADINRIL